MHDRRRAEATRRSATSTSSRSRPSAKPPVCRVLDYSKYKYEQAQKQKAARKHQKQIDDPRDQVPAEDRRARLRDEEGPRRALPASTRTRSRSRSCSAGASSAHPERGTMILDRLAERARGARASIEQRPNLEGRNMTMVLGPSKAVLKGDFDDKAGGDDAPADGDAAEAGADAEAPDGRGAPRPPSSRRGRRRPTRRGDAARRDAGRPRRPPRPRRAPSAAAAGAPRPAGEPPSVAG